MSLKLNWTENPEANQLLGESSLALIIGMLLDQQFPMERAFLGPHILQTRLGRDLDAEVIANLDEEKLDAIFKGPPAIHRFPGSMAKRTQDLCQAIVDDYEGDTSRIWVSAVDGKDLLKRLKALPGFGDAKARVFAGIIGKRLNAGPDGWEDVAADWPSIADVETFDDVFVLREKKRAKKNA